MKNKDIVIRLKDSLDHEIDLSFSDRKELLLYIKQLEKRIYKARKMIFDNYGILDKYGIELLDDILKGDINDSI